MISTEPGYLAHWATLYSYHASPTAEVAFIGEKAHSYRTELAARYLPNSIFLGSETEGSNLPLLKDKTTLGDETTIYVCFNKTCKLPVTSTAKAIEQLK